MRKNLLKKYIEDDPKETEQPKRVNSSTGAFGSLLNSTAQSKVQLNVLSVEAEEVKSVESGEESGSDDEQNEKDLQRYEIQCELNQQGASDLVVDLFMSDISNKVFKENVLLAIALLEGGNTQVQVSDLNHYSNLS